MTPIHPVLTPTRAALAGAAGLSAVAAYLADCAREHDGVTVLDPRVARHVVADRTPSFTDLAHVLTTVGSEAAMGGLALVATVLLLRRRRTIDAAVVVLATGGAAALILVLKAVVARARPGAWDRVGPVDHSFSFPSGHTLSTTVVVGVLVLVAWPHLARRARPLVAGGAVLLVLGVGASRVYLGYHWSTDVLASWSIGSAWVLVVASLARAARGWLKTHVRYAQ